MASKIRKGDKVTVLTGRDKGKTGEVLKMFLSENRAIVHGVNMVKRHTRPSQTNPGGIVEKEAVINLSNLAHVDPKDDKPTRVVSAFWKMAAKFDTPNVPAKLLIYKVIRKCLA